MSQKLHEQNAQEIANNQILKLANQVKLLESKLVTADMLKEDANRKFEQAEKGRGVAVSNRDYERLKADTHEKRADFNGKVAGWLLAVNAILCASILIYLVSHYL